MQPPQNHPRMVQDTSHLAGLSSLPILEPEGRYQRFVTWVTVYPSSQLSTRTLSSRLYALIKVRQPMAGEYCPAFLARVIAMLSPPRQSTIIPEILDQVISTDKPVPFQAPLPKVVMFSAGTSNEVREPD